MSSIWAGQEIEVVGVAGEYQSGKTLFALTIDPKGTLLYDFEKSAGTYAGLNIAKRVDVPTEIAKLHPDGYTSSNLFEWWLEDIRSIKTGEYTVIAVDPASDIEQGLTDYVAEHFADYGFKSKEAFTSTGGIFWSKVKSFWKSVLVDLSTRCQTFVFTSHMRSKWQGGRPTSKREPKGKDTLMELASLYLLLSREKDHEGKVPMRPRGTVLKSRLASVVEKKGGLDIVPTLPPHLPEATPEAIRKYISKPPNYSRLKDDEKVPIEELSEEDKLMIEADIANNKREAAEAELAKAEMQVAAAQKRAARDAARADRTASDKSQEVVAEKKAELKKEDAKAQDSKEEAKKDEPEDMDIELKSLLRTISQQFDDLEISDENIEKSLKARGVSKLVDLTLEQAREVHAKLWALQQTKS